MPIRGEYKEVATSDLSPNPWNPNAQSDFMFEKQQASVREMSFLDPILVRQVEGKLQIIDGEHRWKAASKLGEKKVSVIDLGEVSDHEAKQLTILLNELRGKPERNALAQLITELTTGDGGDLAKLVLPYTQAEFEAFAEMAEFDWSSLDASDPGRDGAETGAEGEGEGKVTLTFELPQSAAQSVQAVLQSTGQKDPADQLLALALAWEANPAEPQPDPES